jgi:hypothetical protein
MQFNTADIKLMQNDFDAWFNGGIVGAITGDKFLNNGSKYRFRKLSLRNEHAEILSQSVIDHSLDTLAEATEIKQDSDSFHCSSATIADWRQLARGLRIGGAGCGSNK